MKIIFCCLLVFALTSVYAKSIGDVPAEEQKNVQPSVDQGTPTKPSTVNVSTAQTQDENQRKYLEAMFRLQQAQIASQMWSIFNSK